MSRWQRSTWRPDESERRPRSTALSSLAVGRRGLQTGSTLLYVSCGPSGGGPCGMFVWSSETGSVAEVPHSLDYVGFPRLSPDRRTILTNGTDRKGRRGLHLIDTASGESKLSLPAAGQAVDWSADGGAFYYLAARSGRRVDRGAPDPVRRRTRGHRRSCRVSEQCALVAGSHYGRLHWPGSRRIRPRRSWSRRWTEAAPQAVFRVAAGEALSNFWSWLPDSRGALLVRTDPREKDSLWHVPLDGTPRRLEVDMSKWTDDGHFHVQPEGKHLAFVANAGEPGAEIWALENVLPRPVK